MSAAVITRFSPGRLDSTVALCTDLDWPSYVEPNAARIAFTAPGSVTYVALDGDRVVGLSHLLTNGVVHAHLSLVGVLPTHRRQGLGRELIQAAFRDSGAKWLDLWSDSDAIEFYRSFLHQERPGFRIYPLEEPTK